MSDNSTESQERDFFASLGRLVVEYNGAENALRNLLASTVTAKPADVEEIALSHILTAELGNMALTQALRSYATDVGPQEMEQPLKDAATYLDTIREYRNFYVHAITQVLTFSDTGTFGQLYGLSAKGSIREHRTSITKDDIYRTAHHCTVAKQFFRDLTFRLEYLRGSREYTYVPPLPHTPPAPSRLSKPALHWREYFPRPPSSQG